MLAGFWARSIEQHKYGTIYLVDGWLVVKEEQGKPVDWSMREIEDCKQDLQELALQMVDELRQRFESSVPELTETLHKCLDFVIELVHCLLIERHAGCIIQKNNRSKRSSDIYKVTVSDKTEFSVVLQEDAMIKALYTNPLFYDPIGREFCIIFDIMYSKTGTEAVAESVYRVAEKQEQDGRQSIAVLEMRTKIDWCFPEVVQCDLALEAMANLYVNGDKTLGLGKHRIPIYKDIRSMLKKDEMSKVIKRIATEKPNLPFLL